MGTKIVTVGTADYEYIDIQKTLANHPVSRRIPTLI
jgi:hypothetical protein